MNNRNKKKLKKIKIRKPIAPPTIKFKSKKDYSRRKHKKAEEKLAIQIL